MLKEFIKISKHMIIYGFGGLLTKALGFFLLPFYTHYILPEEYGIMALVDLVGYFVGVLLSVGVSTSFMKYYYDCKDDNEKNLLISSTHIFVFATGTIILLISLFFSEDICKFVVGDTKSTVLFRLLFLSLFFQAYLDIFTSLLRAKEKSKQYSILQLVRTLCLLTLNIYFIAFLKIGILGIFLSTLVVNIIFSVPFNLWLLFHSGLRISGYYFKEMLIFGLPLIPMGFFELTFHFSDRFFLKEFSTMSAVGIYSVAYKLGGILGIIIVLPFNLVWSAKLFELSTKEHGKEVQRKILTHLLAIAAFIGLAISVPIKEIVQIMTPEKYHEAYHIVPLIVLGYVFYATNWVFRGGLLIHKRTTQISFIAGATAIINVLLNWLLIKPYGALGAAVATVISYFTYSALMHFFSNKCYPVSYESLRIFKLTVTGALIFAVSRFLPEFSLAISIIIKGMLVLIYPILLYFVGFFNSDEKRIIFKTYEKLITAKS